VDDGLTVVTPDQEPERPSVLGEIACEVAGYLGDKGPGRVIGDPEDVDYSALELDDEQRIELGELDRVHDEEVGGQDAARLGGEELERSKNPSLPDLPRAPADPGSWAGSEVGVPKTPSMRLTWGYCAGGLEGRIGTR